MNKYFENINSRVSKIRDSAVMIYGLGSILNNDRIGEVPIDIIRTLGQRFWFTIRPERCICVNR